MESFPQIMTEPYTFDITKVGDERGKIFAFGKLHFDAKNVFWLYMIAGKQRGEHAHRKTKQILFAQVGEIVVDVEHDRKSKRFHLRANGRALYLPEMSWITLKAQTARALCLCIASQPYNKADYIRDYRKYRDEVRKLRPEI